MNNTETNNLNINLDLESLDISNIEELEVTDSLALPEAGASEGNYGCCSCSCCCS